MTITLLAGLFALFLVGLTLFIIGRALGRERK